MKRIQPSLFSKVFAVSIAAITLLAACSEADSDKQAKAAPEEEPLWHGWNRYQIPEEDTLAQYGYELIANTAAYLGPKAAWHNSAMA